MDSEMVAPYGRMPFWIGFAQVGWVQPVHRDLLLTLGCTVRSDGLCLDDAGRLQAFAHEAAAAGAFALRGEDFDVRAEPDGPVIGEIDRGALPVFGLLAEGVHLNGLVSRPGGLHLWVARRAASKALDPGKLDHLVAGGISAGMGPAQTLLKEAAEEAGLQASLASQATCRGTLCYIIERQEGLRRDRLHCYDLMLPDDFLPEARDGEVAGFELWPIRRVIEAVRDTSDFKFNVRPVLIDLFERLGFAGGGLAESYQLSDALEVSKLGWSP